ncbi:MAG TPA: DUF4097 family beta strand repeat-containing protein [Candidatus Acidoferrales bacterium]|nr:DUF4097 family beta strand repeat-containing protein [Candidatus Acidoferrales bacterium]
MGAAALAAAFLQTACVVSSSSASFDRTLKVDGPVELDITGGSGSIVVRTGAPAEIRVHGQVRAGGLFLSSGTRRAQEIAANPPVDQSGNLVRLGDGARDFRFGGVSISYTVETPPDTELRLKNGSGEVQVSGLRRQVSITLGSGSATVNDIGDNVTILIGSGSIRAAHIDGNVNFTSGSGSVSFQDVKEDVRGGTGSGTVQVQRALGRVAVRSGSGPIRVDGARQDVRAATGSGSIIIQGDPADGAFWDLGTGSGTVSLAVPSSASFALSAHTSSGSVRVDMPITIEEQSRRSLRARVGDGKAHVNVETRSGNIKIVQAGTS